MRIRYYSEKTVKRIITWVCPGTYFTEDIRDRIKRAKHISIPDKRGALIDRDKASTQIIAEICHFCASAENGNCDGCLIQKCLEAIGRVPVVVEATE